MKNMLKRSLVLVFISAALCSYSQEIQTLFRQDTLRSSGGYGAITNKFTKINGHYANLTGVYGGWYVNHHFTLGLSAASLTNNLRVPEEYSAVPGSNLSYQYVQFGLFTEYVVASSRMVHLNVQLMSGTGFTTQYRRYDWDFHEDRHDFDDIYDTNWFVVVEPGLNVEINLLKWMRLSTGVSYRTALGSDGIGIKDKDISGGSIDVGLKFGKF